MNDKKKGREILKDTLRKRTDFSQTDQNQGIPGPPFQKPYDPKARRVKLCTPLEWNDVVMDLKLDQIIRERKSIRKYTAKPLSLEELSFLLWATQGIRKVANNSTAYRNVPSAGARHSFETYLFVNNVENLEPALYRFLPLENELLFLRQVPDVRLRLSDAAFNQKFIGLGAVTFVWSCIPYRMEWRYGPTAYRVILIDVGHVCQNLYLGCQAVGAGTCAVAAYDQEAMDELVELDGNDEFAVYLAPVGKIGS